MRRFLSRLETHSKFLGRMMNRCGVDPVRLAQDRCGATLTSVARACMACGRTESCRRWLDAAERDSVNTPPSFCPNAQRFKALREG